MTIHGVPLFQYFDRLEFAIFMKDSLGRYLSINDAGSSMIGSTTLNIIGKDDFSLFDDSSANHVRERDTYIRHSKRCMRYSSIIKNDRGWSRFESLKVPVTGFFNSETHIIGISSVLPGKADHQITQYYSYLNNTLAEHRFEVLKHYLQWRLQAPMPYLSVL